MWHRGPALLPSPTRYCCNIIDSSADGFLAYGTRQNVVVVDIRAKPVVHSITLFKEKVSCLAFCKNKRTMLLAVGGEDGRFKIWNVESKAAEIFHLEINKSLNSLTWKPGSDYIGFVAYGKNVAEWNILKQRHTVLKFSSPIRDDVCVLACSPVEPNMLAAGLRNGMVAIYDTCNGKMVHHFYGTYHSICCLSWPSHTTGQILVSYLDGNVRLWTLSKNPNFKVFNEDKTKSKMKTWVSAIWHPLEPNTVITTTFTGGIFLHKLVDEEYPEQRSLNYEGGCHMKMVPNLIVNEFSKNMVISSGTDSKILFWDLNTEKCIFEMFTIGGFIHHVEFSPVDSGRLAIASNEGALRVWNVASTNDYSVKMCPYVSKSRVTYIAWHPEKDNYLAFGTEEGRVGVFDVDASRYGSCFVTKHCGTIYSLNWGPFNKAADLAESGETKKKPKSKFHLYSCGGGKIYIHHPSNIEKLSVDFDDVLTDVSSEANRKRHGQTELSWKTDYTVFAVGTEEGCIDVYDGESFQLMATLLGSKKIVNCVKWHPEYVSISSTKCTMHNWLAVGTAEVDICVYDLSVLNEYKGQPIEVWQPARILKGHQGKITDISWSPHVAGRLVSSSFDRTVQVWDVLSAEPIVNFQGHTGRVFTVEWSLLDPDTIFSGGEDYCLFKWRISEQVEVAPPKDANKQRVKTKAEKMVHEDDDDAGVGVNGQLDRQLEPGSTEESGKKGKEHDGGGNRKNEDEAEELFTKGSVDEVIPENVSPLRAESSNETRSKKKRKKEELKVKKVSLFPNWSRKFYSRGSKIYDDLIELTDILCSNNKEDREKLGKGELSHLCVFGDEISLFSAVEEEKLNLESYGCGERALIHSVWKGNLREVLREASEKDKLSDLHLALAPMVSYSLWLELCEKYVAQLTKDHEYQRATTFLLTCHKVNEAIQYLEKYVGPRDAYILAKLRLPHTDPLLNELLSKWCMQLMSEGNHSLAAACYLAMGQSSSAASSVSRGNAASERTAAYISKKYGNMEDAKYYSLKCLKASFQRSELQVAKCVISEQPELEGFQILVHIAESVAAHKSVVKTSSEWGLYIPLWPGDGSALDEEVTVWKCYTVEGESYLYNLFVSLLTEDDNTKAEFVPVLEKIKYLLNEELCSGRKEIQYVATLNIAACLYSILLADSEEEFINSFNYINNIFSSCLNVGWSNELHVFCTLLFPFDVVWRTKEKALRLKPAGTQSCLQAFQSSAEVLARSICSVFEDRYLTTAKNLFAGCSGFLSHLSAIEKAFSSLTVADSLLAHFALNFIQCLSQNISGEKKTFEWLCSRNVTETGSNLNEISELQVQELTNVVQDSSSPVIDSVAQSDPCQLSVDNESSAEPQKDLGSLDGNAVEKMAEVGGTNVASSSCDKNELNDTSHGNCEGFADLFFRLLDAFSGCTCHEIFGMKNYLKELKEKANTQLLYLKISKKHENTVAGEKKLTSLSSSSVPVSVVPESKDASPEENISCEPSTDKSEMFSSDKTSTLNDKGSGASPDLTGSPASVTHTETEDNKKNDIAIPVDTSDNSAAEVHTSQETNLLEVELESHIEQIQKIQAVIEELAKAANFPDCLLSAKELLDFCEQLTKETSCPDVRSRMSVFQGHVKSWVENFKTAMECLVMAQD